VTVSVLTPLQLDAGAGLLQNQGIVVNSAFLTALSTYNNSFVGNLRSTISTGATGNILANATIATLQTLASNTCPALADSVPSGYPNIVLSNSSPGLTGFLAITADTYVGNGDIGKFAQALSISDGYASQTNLFVNTAVNSQTYLGNTFTTMNSMITGELTDVNLATQAFGSDLAKLGQLIDLDDLGNLGSPLSLIRRIVNVVGNVPVLNLIFVVEGVPEEVVINIGEPEYSVTDSVQKLIYQAMTKITGDVLNQILALFSVTTPNINTMADLLNPVKLFPNSFQSLTTVTANGLQAIYIDSTGTVNSKLSTELPDYVLRTVV
jgi:hypothetical protein